VDGLGCLELYILPFSSLASTSFREDAASVIGEIPGLTAVLSVRGRIQVVSVVTEEHMDFIHRGALGQYLGDRRFGYATMRNNIGSEGARALAVALKVNKILLTLK
jgi:hypothetical protein